MKKIKTKVIVIKETNLSLIVISEDGPKIVRKTLKFGTVHESTKIQIPKSKICNESDKLGMPAKGNDKLPEEERTVLKGELVIPEWLAMQRGIWKQ